MRDILRKRFFPYVIKPGRYTGGEPGQVVKSHTGRVTYAHAYPDKYEVGQSYPGLQTIYHIVNSDDRFVCERVFAPDSDADRLLREEDLPLSTLETGTPVKQFDAFGFTLAYELVYTNMLTMLDLAGIPLLASERTDDHPLVLAGGPAVYNPEPLVDFVDLFFIGDAEEGMIEILEVLRELKGQSREAKLEQICRQVKSVYIPRFYDDDRRPAVDFAPEQIEARVIPELKPEFYPEQPILPLVDTAHQHLSVEIMRGCPQGCRYCQAGPMYRPVRARPVEDVLHQIDEQMRNTGYSEVSLLSLSSSDYPCIEELAPVAARRLEPFKVSISLPALRPGTISPTLLDAAARVRQSGLTIAPEAGTERLRLFIRKDFPDQAVYDTVRLAFMKGWGNLKLYFMIGLPTETDDDLMGILRMVERIWQISREYPRRTNINVTLSPFAPRPHTPFQWDEVAPISEIIRKANLIRKKNRLNHVRFKHHMAETSILQAVLGRGDRRMGTVILGAWKQGARFDGWTEHFDWEIWQSAFRMADVDPTQLMRAIPFDADLPWSHIRKGVSVDHLKKERENTSRQMRDYQRLTFDEAIDDAERGTNGISFGRGKKKVASRSQAAPTKNRIRIRWEKADRYRYMSHLDNVRFIERAVRRARLPVAYSQGYNPTMKLSFGPPLPVGFTSEAEYVDITLESNLLPSMLDNLKSAMPDGSAICDASVILGKSPSLTARLNRAEYTIPVDALSEEAQTDLQSTIEKLIAAESLEIERQGKEQVKIVDIRPAIYDLTIRESHIVMTLGIGDGGYARPSEVLPLLDDQTDARVLSFMAHRKDVYRMDDAQRISAMEV
jgi:radical SAM family uncharacterized protein/radical SAM-linked protein